MLPEEKQHVDFKAASTVVPKIEVDCNTFLGLTFPSLWFLRLEHFKDQ